jgi:hypothetical protein
MAEKLTYTLTYIDDIGAMFFNIEDFELAFPCRSQADGEEKARSYLKTINWPADTEFKYGGEKHENFEIPACGH